MKLALISDVHANFSALEAALTDIETRGCDLTVHLGDAIAIGSQPAECVETLLNLQKALFIMGNHDAYFVEGIPSPQPHYMTDGEVSHHQWTRRQIETQLGNSAKDAMSQWQYKVQQEVEGVSVVFVHYALDESGKDFISIERNPSSILLDALFATIRAKLICYGHTHYLGDLVGRKRYLNVPSLGCQPSAVAPYTMITLQNGEMMVEQFSVSYDDKPFLQAYDTRQVPERHMLRKRFLGGR